MGTPVTFLAVGLALLIASAWLSNRFASAEKPVVRVLAEIAGYAGIAFALAGAMTLLGQYWDRTSTAVHIGVPAVLAVMAYACAIVVERARTESARRLSQVLYAGAVAAVGGTCAMIVYPIAVHVVGEPTFTGEGTYAAYKDAGAWAGFAAAVGIVVAGAITWALRPGVATQVATALGTFMCVLNGFGLLVSSAPFWVSGVVMLLIGIVWAAFGVLERAQPANTAIAVGCALAIFGVMQLFERDGQEQLWATWLGMALSIAAILLSIRLKRGVMLGFGAAGVVVFAFAWTQMVYEGRLAGPVILLVTGVTFIGMAVLVAFMLPRLRSARSSGDDDVRPPLDRGAPVATPPRPAPR